MFQVVGAMAEFERALIQERVRCGLKNARANGKQLGRPRTMVNPEQVAALRTSGASWRVISQRLGIGVGTASRALGSFQKPLGISVCKLLILRYSESGYSV